MTERYTAINPHTGSLMVSKPATKAYSDGWDRIFGKKTCEHCEKPVARDVQVEYNGMLFHEFCFDEWVRNESDEMEG